MALSEPSVPWVPTHDDVLQVVLELLRPRPGDTVYELGCGDGRVAVAIAKRYRVPVVCIELRSDLVKRALRNAAASGVDDLVKVVEANFFEIDMSDARIVYMYLLTSVNQKLRPKLERELTRGSVVVSLDFPIPGWNPVGFIELPRSWQRILYVYARGFSDEGVLEGIEDVLARINLGVMTYVSKELLSF
jgi:SAM-dependent methyltransferase